MNNQELARALRTYGDTVTTLYGTPVNDGLFQQAAEALLNSEPIVKSNWVYQRVYGVWTTKCNNCGYKEPGDKLRKYHCCPMCYAHMTQPEQK